MTKEPMNSNSSHLRAAALLVSVSVFYFWGMDCRVNADGGPQSQSLIASGEQYDVLAKWHETYFMKNTEVIGSRVYKDREIELDSAWSALPFYFGWDADGKASFDADAFAKQVFSGGRFNNVSASNYVKNWRCLNTDGKQALLGGSDGGVRQILCRTQFDLTEETRSVDNLLENGGNLTRFAHIEIQLEENITKIVGDSEVFVNDVLEFDGIVACVRMNRGLFFGFSCTAFAERVQNLGGYSDGIEPADGVTVEN